MVEWILATTLAITARTASPGRMLREGVGLLEMLAAQTPLILAIEDMHWSDAATVDMLNAVALRREPARLLVVLTQRPADAIVHQHPVQQLQRELSRKRLCEVVALDPLDSNAVLLYLQRRFPGATITPELVQTLSYHTGGLPLFLTSIADDLVTRGWLAGGTDGWQLTVPVDQIGAHVPHTLRDFVEQSIEQLGSTERDVLAAASTAGVPFAAPAVAAALSMDVASVETSCDGLARRHRFIAPVGVTAWPDGTLASVFHFTHALYQRAFYTGIAPSVRRGFHQRIGERLERGFEGATQQIAAQLAAHFEASRDHERAVRYLRQAGKKALQRFAGREAVGYFERALKSLLLLPESPERQRRELALHLELCQPTMSLRGNAAPQTERQSGAAVELARQLGDGLRLFTALVLHGYALYTRGELAAFERESRELLALAAPLGPGCTALAHGNLGKALFRQGRLREAADLLARADPPCSPEIPGWRTHNGVDTLATHACLLALTGKAEQSRQLADRALRAARATADPFVVAIAHGFLAPVYDIWGDAPAAQAAATEVLDLAAEHGFSQFEAEAVILRGWARDEQGDMTAGIADLEQGIRECERAEIRIGLPAAHAWLARARIAVGNFAEARAAIDQGLAIAEQTGEGLHTAELWRLRGKVLQHLGWNLPESRRCFEQGMTTAETQGAIAWAQRAQADLRRVAHPSRS
jgi:tetratricopeptide (TPR) repeat protein